MHVRALTAFGEDIPDRREHRLFLAQVDADDTFSCRTAREVRAALMYLSCKRDDYVLLVICCGEIASPSATIKLPDNESFDIVHEIASSINAADVKPQLVLFVINPYPSCVTSSKKNIPSESLKDLIRTVSSQHGHLCLWASSRTSRKVLLKDEDDEGDVDAADGTQKESVHSVLLKATVSVMANLDCDAAVATAAKQFDAADIPCAVDILWLADDFGRSILPRVGSASFTTVATITERSRLVSAVPPAMTQRGASPVPRHTESRDHAVDELDSNVDAESKPLAGLNPGAAPFSVSASSSTFVSAPPSVVSSQPSTQAYSTLTQPHYVPPAHQPQGPGPPYAISVPTGRRGINFCSVCNCEVFGDQNWQLHLSSDKHKRKLTLMSPEYSNVARDPSAAALLLNPQNFFKCELCNVVISGQTNIIQHINGLQHQKNSMPKMGIVPPPHAAQAWCNECQSSFATDALYDEHMTTAHGRATTAPASSPFAFGLGAA